MFILHKRFRVKFTHVHKSNAPLKPLDSIHLHSILEMLTLRVKTAKDLPVFEIWKDLITKCLCWSEVVVSLMCDGLEHSGLKEIPWEVCAHHFCHCSSKQNIYALVIIHLFACSSDCQEKETICSAIMDTTLKDHF